jgi:hypothetical protein
MAARLTTKFGRTLHSPIGRQGSSPSKFEPTNPHSCQLRRMPPQVRRENEHNMGDIKDHSWETLDGNSYDTIQNHCTIHLNGQASVSVNRVEDHCNISGDCQTFSIGSMADHVYICTTGKVNHGPTGDHCDITENASNEQVAAWQAARDRPGNPGN